MPPQDTLALVIAPRHQILRDARANIWAIFIALALLIAYIVCSSVLISHLET